MFLKTFVSCTLGAGLALAQPSTYIVAAGYAPPQDTLVSPGQIITLFVRGLNVSDAAANTDPLPTTLSGVTIAVKNPPTPSYPTSFPILSVRSFTDACGAASTQFCNTTAVTVQVPFEPTCIPAPQIPNSCTIGAQTTVRVATQVNGVSGQEFGLAITGLPHLLNACDSIFGVGGLCSPVVTHADGSLVSLSSPAHPGEEVIIYAVGLGATRGGAKTGYKTVAPDPVLGYPYFTPAFRINTLHTSAFFVSGPSIQADWAGLTPGYVGLYQINVALPDTLPDGIQQCPGENLNVRLLLQPSLEAVSQDAVGTAESVDLCVTQ